MHHEKALITDNGDTQELKGKQERKEEFRSTTCSDVTEHFSKGGVWGIRDGEIQSPSRWEGRLFSYWMSSLLLLNTEGWKEKRSSIEDKVMYKLFDFVNQLLGGD